eukprot:jgi/Bigna1/73561/fgenesh1_pg.24_\
MPAIIDRRQSSPPETSFMAEHFPEPARKIQMGASGNVSGWLGLVLGLWWQGQLLKNTPFQPFCTPHLAEIAHTEQEKVSFECEVEALQIAGTLARGDQQARARRGSNVWRSRKNENSEHNVHRQSSMESQALKRTLDVGLPGSVPNDVPCVLTAMLPHCHHGDGHAIIAMEDEVLNWSCHGHHVEPVCKLRHKTV